MAVIMFLNAKSIKNISTANISVVTITTMAEFCNCAQVG
jgi:hypothetical protein